MHDMLVKIVERERSDLAEKKKKMPLEKLRMVNYGKKEPAFRNSLFHIHNSRVAVIAEVKLASPSAGSLGNREDIIERVRQYEEGGAVAISVITEPHFFHGDVAFIAEVKKAVSLPVLQKDFVIDAYQLYEASAAGADAILLIARLVERDTLREMVSLANELGLEPVVEVASESDLEKAYAASPLVIAVNARDLDTFTVDVHRACELLETIPKEYICLGFSGIHGLKEVTAYREAGAQGVLIGTALMKAGNIKGFIQSLNTSH